MRKSLSVIAMVFVVLGILCVAGTAQADLQKYDDFNDATASAGLWTAQSDDPGSVQYENGSAAYLWMRAGRENAYSRAISTNAFQLADANDSLTVAFDFRHVWSSTTHDGQAGLSLIYDDGTHVVGTGAYGRASNNADNSWKNTVNVGSPAWQGLTKGTRAVFGEYHYEMTLTTTSVDVDVYAINAAWDATPDMYATATPLESFSLGASAAAGTDLHLMMWHFSPDAVDPWTDGDRGGSTFDNVYVNQVVPEPVSMVLLGIGGSLGLLRRRR